jgi:sodium-independent sulfate anion transporter 11
MNILNSFFGGMAVGGAASRTAVNSESAVKSPLGGIFTTGAVLVSTYALTGALFWIPKATLSAVIIVAVWQIVVPISVFISYWKISFTDFVASQLAFWITLFVSAEMGIELATLFMIFCTVLQVVFSKGKTVTRDNFASLYPSSDEIDVQEIPTGTQIVKLSYPIIFLNAARAKISILDAVQTYKSGMPSAFASTNKDPARLWNELGSRHISLLRQKANISPLEAEYLPQIRVVMLDMRSVIYMDTTGVEALKGMKSELKAYARDGVEMRVVGLKNSLVGKFERAGWKMVYAHEAKNMGTLRNESCLVIYEGLREAIADPGFQGVGEFGEKGVISVDEIDVANRI